MCLPAAYSLSLPLLIALSQSGDFQSGGGAIATRIFADDGVSAVPSRIVVTDCVFSNSTAARVRRASPGSVVACSARSAVKDQMMRRGLHSRFAHCSQGWGGALQSPNLLVNRCRFVGNTALGGGAISAVGTGQLVVSNSTLQANTASIAGGAVHIFSAGPGLGAAARLDNTALWDNAAVGSTARGGAIAAFAANLTVTGCTLMRNGATPAEAAAKPGTEFIVSAAPGDLVPGVRARKPLPPRCHASPPFISLTAC